MAVIAFLAPLLANRKPLMQRTSGGWSFPALGDYFVGDPDIDRPGLAPTFTHGAITHGQVAHKHERGAAA